MNKLYCTTTSPFARKARVLIRELGLQDQFEEVLVAPLDDPAALLAANPLSKVPALQLANGELLYDSQVICEWLLSHRSPGAPGPGDSEQWQMRRRVALADGIIDSTVSMSFEVRRPAELQSQYWLGRWTRAIERGVDALEAEVGSLGDELDAVTAASALAYIDFRQAQINWRQRAPALASWFEVFIQRPAMQATIPG